MKKNLPLKNVVLFAIFLFFSIVISQSAIAQNWQLVHPVYTTTDDIVAGYSVADYGATGDGVTDVTSIFQSRLNALGTAGGGTLWVPAGKYVISGNLVIPKGVTLRGDWQQPVPGQPIVGTILMAYAGRGDTAAAPFITEQTACAVMDVAIWYPQQDPNNIVPYPNAIQMGQDGFWGNDFNNAKNITLVNAYEGVELSLTNGGGCPIIMGIYGTPLSTGIMVDNIADVGRLENIDFSAAYWEGSGLPGSPAAGSSVEGFIYQHGTGILMRRDDWTYTSFVSVKGYGIGFRAALSIASPGAIPNGHNYGMTFTNCNTGIYFDGVSNVGIMFANVTMSGCTNGIVIGPGATTNGAAQFHTCTIDATNAISTDPTSAARLMMERCTISRGKVDIGGGTFMANDCDFNNTAPQIIMEKNSRSIITGNRFHVARQIQNNSLWVSAIDSTTTFTLKQLPSFPTIVPETHQAARQVMYLASAAPYNAKNDGTTDNTTAIQSALNQAAADGGGIVFLPPGHYKVAGDLTIASGVELKGASDLSAAPYGPGSVLEVTADAGNPSGSPFLKLAANSGVRGIVFDYPNQVGSLVPNFPAYPYTIQGGGSNIYIINIGFRSVYNGIDLFTNKCDNHYVDYVCGQVFQNVFTVGGASTGGKIYNAHFNTIYYANGTESKFGTWANSPTTDGDPAVYNYNYNNCKFLNLGNCQNETLYNDFIYGSQQGINLNSDAGSAPTGISLGLGIDGTRNSMNFNAIGGAGFDFINTQTVALGDAGNRYITTTSTLGSSNTTLFNSDYWGNPPNGIILNGGTLNLQQANFNQPGQTNFGDLTAGALNIFGSAIWPVNAELNAGAEHLLNAQSSIIDSSNIIRPNVAVWKNNLGNAWAVNPLMAMPRTGWSATGSVDNGDAQNALDSNETTRWSTNGVQSPGQTYTVDMKNLKQFYQIALENANGSGDYPAGYAVYVSTDGVNWGSPIATGVGSSGLTIITFPTQIARYIKVVQTGTTTGNYWSIYEFYVFGVDYHATIGVTVSPSSATMNAGTTQQLTATLTPANASDLVVAWTSSDITKATVDSTGLVTAITAGAVTITATTQDGNQTSTSAITINAVASPGGLNYPALLGYWQNWDDPTSPFILLDQVDPKYNNVIVAFATPINGNEYQIGFTPYNVTQATFITQIQTLHSQGRKVLISIGGEGAPVSITSTAQEATFVSTVESILNTYNFDGVDIDFEGTSLSVTNGSTIAAPVDAPEIYLIAALKQIMQDYRAAHSKKMLLTMAPETADVQGGMSAYSGIWGSYLPIINGLKDSLDVLQTQLYNSGSMYGLDGNVYTVGTADFIVAETEAAIKGFTTAGGLYAGLPATKVAVGLPSCVTAAGSGFTDTATVHAAMNYLLGKGPKPGSYTLEQTGGYPNLEGMMDWSINYDKFCSNDSYATNFVNIFDSTTTTPTTETPYGGIPWPIPGTIQSEDYDNGGQGTAYNDSDPTNDGGQYRPTEGVDVEASAEGGFDVGYTAAGEWLKYTVNVTTPGIYTMQSRIAANSATGAFHVNIDAANISGTVAVPNTGGFQYWQTLNTTTTFLTAGQHVMTVFIDAAGFNINYINFVGPVTAGLTATIAAPLNNVIYNAPATLPITANVSTTTGTITKVEFYSNGTKIGESDAGPYTFNWTGVAAGTYSITAKVTNSGGSTTVSVPVAVTVNPAIPNCPLLTWSDEFNGTTLDATKWNYQTGNGCPGICGWGNNELEYYTNNTNNVSVSGGALALTAQYQPNYIGSGNNYTSGKIVTLGDFSQKYGHFEARIKVPSAAGTWPAFWMLADSTAWPQTGEIDIEECANQNPVTWFGTLHFANAGGSHLSQGYQYNSLAPLSNDYHVYAADWTTDSISFYIDSVLRGTVSKTALIAAGGVWPFDSQKFYIIMNLAVGGNFTGQTPDPTQFPQSMLVDYVRVYSKDPCTATPETPYGGTAWPIPGTIQAENYDNGGQGVAYNDSDPTNDGGQYRTTEGVDVEACTDTGGGYDVGYTATGEWEKYTVNVNTAGIYTMQARVASTTAGNSLHVEIDGVTIGTIAVPNTTGFQTFQTVSVTTPALTVGQHIMRIYMETGGFNLNYVTFLLPAPVPVITSANTASGNVGVAFSNYTITATNTPTSYSVAETLPAGLSFSGNVISGTPTVAGTFVDTVKATNANGTGVQVLTITIGAAPSGCSTSMVVNATSVPTIDGTVDAVWNNAPKNAITKSIQGTIQTGSTWQAMYDATNLYVLVQVKDANTSSVGTNLWDQDGVELFIAGNNNKTNAYTANDHQYRFNWNVAATTANISGTTGSTAGITYAIPSATGGYNLEVAIPWTTIGGTAPSNGKAIGFDININDQQDNTTTREAIAGWNGTATDDFNNPGDFGTVNLTVCAATAPVVTSATTASGTLSTAFSYSITATNTPTSYSVTGTLPAGVTINTSTGVISGTPTVSGTFAITVNATNAGGTGTQALTITILPNAPVITSAATASGTISTAFSYSITATNTPTSYSVTGTLPTGVTINTATGVISGTPTVSGTFAITIKATNAGGTGTQALTITILPNAPVITSAATASGTISTAFSYSITATNTPISYSVTGTLPAGVTINTSTGVISGTPTVSGTFAITVNATNAGGTGTQALTITILPNAPVITSAATASGTISTAFSYGITATNTPTSYSETGTLPAGVTINTTTGVISGTPTVSGTFAITVNATNAGGTGTQALTITILPNAPVITSAATASGTISTAFSYSITATSIPISYSVTGTLPAGVTINASTGVISGTPTVSGTFAITIKATNAGGTGTQALTIAILPNAPVITSAATASGIISTAFSYSITATNTPTSYSVTGTLPAGVTINTSTGVISGTPTVSGTFAITVNATNAGGTGTQSLTITILPNAPVITSVATASGTISTAFSYSITATNTPTSYSETGTLPAGVTINTTTGVISGTPTVSGTFAITIKATNAGGTGTQALIITILPNAPVITSSTTASGTISTAFSYSITATNTPTSYSETGTLPAGVMINTTTGVISGTPTVSGTFAITINATNAGGTGTQALIITILPSAPVITSSTTASGTISTAFSYSITAMNTPTSYSVTGTLPAGVTINTATGVISGTPTVSGTFAITIKATNAGGTGTQALTITILPNAPVITSAATASGTISTAFSYSITATNTPTSYSETGTLPAGVTINTSTGVISGTPTVSGTFAIAIKATNAGGTGTQSLTITILPNAPVITSAATASGTISTAFSYSITATNTPTSYSVTGTLPAGLALIGSSITGTPSVAGTFTVTLNATNAGGTGTQSLIITILPNAPVITSATTASGTVGTAFNYTIVATNVPTGYAETGTLPAGVTINTATGVISGTPTASGTFAITVQASNAGGTGTQSLTITINAAIPGVPVITSLPTAGGTVGTAFSYTITATNTPTGYSVTGTLPTGVTASPTTGIISGTPTVSGTFTITLNATNAGGTGTQTLTITILPNVPVITSALTTSGTIGLAFSYIIVATNTPTSYSETGSLPAGVSITGNVLSGTPTASGTFTVTIKATNAGGTGTQTLTITILPAAPVITSSTTASGTVGTIFNYAITATNTPTSYSETGALPAGVTINTVTGVISGTPTASGTFTITIKATNAGGAGTQSLTITINAAIPGVPVITGATTASGTVGTTFNYTIVATNTPSSYSVTGALPAGVTINASTGIISGTPTTSGTFTVTINATNAGGTGTQTLTITISPAAPVITSAATASGTVGTAFNYAITATNTPTSYSETGALPAGVTINTVTGVISGTPTAFGTFAITIKATNAGGTGTRSLTITINAAIPVITSLPTTGGAIGSEFTYNITATNSPTSYSSTTLPAGLIINTTTGVISGTPTVSGSFTDTIKATNAAGTGTEIITIAINSLPGIPLIISNGAVSGVVGTSFSYTIVATNAPTSYNAINLPVGLSINTVTGEITGVPLTIDTSRVMISATNASGTTNNILTIGITALPVPVINSADTATATEGQSFTYILEASNTPTSYGATGLPAGVTIDPATGIISGEPTVAGTFAVMLTATNSFGTSTEVLTLTVASVSQSSDLTPNPVTDGHFKLTLPGWPKEEMVNVEIMNFIGKLVQKGTATINEDGYITVNVPGLIAGDYVVIVMDTNKREVKKFIVK